MSKRLSITSILPLLSPPSARGTGALTGLRYAPAAMLDMNLNGDKSHSVADALAAREVPFFFSTGYSGRDMRDGYRDRPLLIKPFQFEKLAEIFARLLPGQIGQLN